MIKKQKRKHHRRRRKAKNQEWGGFRLRPLPLNGVDPEVVKKALLAVAEREAENFPKLIEAMLDRLRQKYPPLLIAIVAAYSLQAGVTKDGEIQGYSNGMFQDHLEVMQALAMTLTKEEWGAEPAISGDVDAAMETLKAMAESFSRRRFKVLEKEADGQARAVISLQEKLRLFTQRVRNWGSFSQVIRLSTELYAPLDDCIRAKKGFSAIELIVTARHMVGMLEERANDRMRRLHRVFREHKPRKIAQAYYRNHPYLEGDADQFMKAMPPNVTRENVLAAVMNHADLMLEDMMMFTADMVSAKTGLPADVTERILSALGKTPGDFKGEKPEHLFMANPIWEYPVINLGDKHFCAMPQAVFSHIHRILHSIAEEIGTLRQLEKRRSKFLEGKVAELLGKFFPTGTLRNGTKWRLGAVEYETDHLLLIDNVALIAEDKSHGLTEKGLRGAPERVREHVRDLIAAPSEQSERLEAMILRAKGKDSEAITALLPFGIDFSLVDRVIRINVTLDDLTMLASEEDELKASGWIRADLQLVPTMTLADLETVSDILERPSFLLHYLSERMRVQKEGRVFADEIDFLGVYLDMGLNMGDLNAQNLQVSLTGSSAPIDNFFNVTDAGFAVPKPRPKLSPYYSELVSMIEKRAPPGWATVTTDVLRSAVFDEQFRIEKALAELRTKVEANWSNPGHECCLIIRSHPLRNTALVFFAYPPQLAHRRRERAEEMAAQILDRGEVKRCVLISRDTSRWDEAYSSIFVAESRGGPVSGDAPAPVEQEKAPG